MIGALNLYQWFDQVRNGDQAALRSVTIQSQNEDHTAVVQSWKLLRARIVKFSSGPFNAQSTDVALEEIVLAYERSSSSEGAVRGGPLGRSNFVVQWGGASAAAQGFAEVIFPPFAVAGEATAPDAAPQEGAIAATTSHHLMLRRGATGALDLYDWWDRARRGQAPCRRVVTVRLLGADQRSVVMTWRFRNARPVSLAYSPLLAMDAGVLMETIVIAFDDVEMV